MDVAAARRDDAGRDRAAEAEGIAHREHPVADARRVGIAEGNARQGLAGIDFQQGDIRLLVGADQLGRIVLAVVEGHDDIARLFDHMVVGHHIARGIDDEARTERRYVLASLAMAAEVMEELLEGRTLGKIGHLRIGRCFLVMGRRDIDHRRRHFGGQVGEGLRRQARRRGHAGKGYDERRHARRHQMAQGRPALFCAIDLRGRYGCRPIRICRTQHVLELRLVYPLMGGAWGRVRRIHYATGRASACRGD